MKKIIIVLAALVSLTLGASTHAAFTPGNLLVYRLGGNASGGTTVGLTNSGVIVWLDEYTTAGSLVQSVMMPTNYFGANSPLIGAGTTFGSGLIGRSQDGRFVVAAGYGGFTNQNIVNSLQSSFGTDIPRVIALVDGNGNIDTTTAITNDLYTSGNEVRSATSTDGTNLWLGSDQSGFGFIVRGLSDCTQLSGGNIRQVSIVSNVLYFDSVSAPGNIHVGTVGTTPPPTTNNSSLATLPGVPTADNASPEGFALLNLTGGAGPDTLYVADNSTISAAAVVKYSLVGGVWVNNGSIGMGGLLGLAAQASGGVVSLFTTGGGSTLTGSDSLWGCTDSGGYNAAPVVSGNPFVPLTTSAASVSFRGVQFVPVGGETFPSGAGTLSVGPVLGYFSSSQTGCSATETDKYSVANFGASPINWTATCSSNWVTITPASGSLGAGGSITIAATFNASAQALLAGTNTTTIVFANASNGNGNTTRPVSLVVRNQKVSPTSDFVSSGQPGGPFSPASKVYTLSNGTNATDVLVTGTTVNWLNISVPSISLGSCSSTDITVSVNNSVATNLPSGVYSGKLTFSNTTAGVLIDSDNVTLIVGGLYFCDDFSTYNQNATLVPQQGWTDSGSYPTALEPFVTNGAVYVAATSQAVSADEPYKILPVTSNGTVFAGMVLVVTSAPPNSVASPSRITCFFNKQAVSGSGVYATDFLSVRDTGSGTFFNFVGRMNGFTANSNIFSTVAHPYNVPIRVIVSGEAAWSNQYIYVNPSSPVLNTANAELALHVNSWSASDKNIGAFQIGNTFGGNTTLIPGVAFQKICLSTNYSEVYADIQPGATNKLTITSISRSGNNIVINWNGLTGANVVQVNPGVPPTGSYVTNTFSDLATVTLGSPGPATYTDINGATNSPTRYYRIHATQ